MEAINRVEVKLTSIRALEQAMQFRKMNPTDLADATQRMYGRKSSDIRPIGRQIVSHLLNGTRTRCSANTAAAIEGALDVTPGSLFSMRVLPDSRNTQREVAA